jgi:hypothetical protein
MALRGIRWCTVPHPGLCVSCSAEVDKDAPGFVLSALFVRLTQELNELCDDVHGTKTIMENILEHRIWSLEVKRRGIDT